MFGVVGGVTQQRTPLRPLSWMPMKPLAMRGWLLSIATARVLRLGVECILINLPLALQSKRLRSFSQLRAVPYCACNKKEGVSGLGAAAFFPGGGFR